MALTDDNEKAFLQVRINPKDRDVLLFQWVRNKDPSAIEVLRFTRAPFLLARTLRLHLEALREKYPEEVDKILRSLYVDDAITGGSMI